MFAFLVNINLIKNFLYNRLKKSEKYGKIFIIIGVKGVFIYSYNFLLNIA